MACAAWHISVWRLALDADAEFPHMGRHGWALVGMMEDYWAMGGYAAYVWPAYGVAAVALLGMLWASLAGLRRREALLRMLETGRVARRRGPRREAAVAGETVRAASEAGTDSGEARP